VSLTRSPFPPIADYGFLSDCHTGHSSNWHMPGGWLLVHDALGMGPRQHADTVTPHTRPPADDDAAHLLVRTVECLEGTVEVELVCEPAFDYGRVEATWTLADTGSHQADAVGMIEAAGRIILSDFRRELSL
jgi:hypothetical protein